MAKLIQIGKPRELIVITSNQDTIRKAFWDFWVWQVVWQLYAVDKYKNDVRITVDAWDPLKTMLEKFVPWQTIKVCQSAIIEG